MKGRIQDSNKIINRVILNESKESLLAGDAHFLRGNILAFFTLERGEQLLNTWKLSLEIFKKNNKKLRMARTFGNLALFHKWHGDFKKAKELHCKAISILQSEKDFIGLGIEYVNYADTLLDLGSHQDSLNNVKKGVQILSKNGFPDQFCYAKYKEGSIFFRLSELFYAEVAIKQALQYSLMVGDKENERESLKVLASIYIVREWWEDATRLIGRIRRIQQRIQPQMKVEKVNIPSNKKLYQIILKTPHELTEYLTPITNAWVRYHITHWNVIKQFGQTQLPTKEINSIKHFGSANRYRELGKYKEALRELRIAKNLWNTLNSDRGKEGSREVQVMIDELENKKYIELLNRKFDINLYLKKENLYSILIKKRETL